MKFCYCIKCKKWFETSLQSCILVDIKNGKYVRCDVHECPKCGFKILPGEAQGEWINKWEMKEGEFERVIGKYWSANRCFFC